LSLFRRREPLHVKLARAGGIPLGEPAEAAAPPGEPAETPPPLREPAGIHGLQRARAWDAVATVSAPDLPGERVEFVALAPGELVVLGEGSAGPLAAAIERKLAPPYRAEAVRREGGLWAVGGRRIEVVRLPDTDGEEIELVASGDERTLLVDGEPAFGSIPALERDGHVVRARRIGGDAWEVDRHPL
jgi:hypothetical protein